MACLFNLYFEYIGRVIKIFVFIGLTDLELVHPTQRSRRYYNKAAANHFPHKLAQQRFVHGLQRYVKINSETPNAVTSMYTGAPYYLL